MFRGLVSGEKYPEQISRELHDDVKECFRSGSDKYDPGDYKNLQIPDESIIYCDPPYMATAGYSGGVSHDEFWQWCRERVYDGHKVYVSEYQAPDDFITIWEKSIQNCISLDKKATERLFIYEGQF